MMTEQQAKNLAEILNGELKSRVSNAIFNALGVSTSFVAEAKICFGYLYLTAKEERINGYGATRAQLTATPLLCAMFQDASLEIRFSLDENLNKLIGDVHINYEHSNFNGRNGLGNLARIVFALDNYKF